MTATDRTTATGVRAWLAELAAAHAAVDVRCAWCDAVALGNAVSAQGSVPSCGAPGHGYRGTFRLTPADAAAIVAEHNAVPDLLAAVTAALDLADELDRREASLLRSGEVTAARLRTAIAAHLTPGETR